jgi:hypothetical protein
VSPADFKHTRGVARRLAHELGLASRGQHVLVVAGYGKVPAESAPSVTVLTI